MSERLPVAVRAYRTALAVLEPAAAGLLLWRRSRGLEEAARLGERQGWPGRQRPSGHLVWVHGASIGETLSLLPAVERLTQRGLAVLVTSGTRTSAALVERRLPPGSLHQFVPLDVPRYIRRFLDHWQPDMALIAKSEIWPNTILELEKRQVPLVLVNGRMSDRSFERWQKLPAMIAALLQRFALCIAQTNQDAERLARLGAPRVAVAGNLKFDGTPPPADPRAVAQLSGLIAGRPVWLAASTHPGEDEVVIAVHKALAAHHPHLLTILAPRHPQRGADIAALAERAGQRASLRSQSKAPDRGTDVYIADTIGDMGLFYRVAPLVFVGATMVPVGGHNPIEAAKLGAAILHGPHIANAQEIFDALDTARGALLCKDERGLARALTELLSDPALTREMARNATDVVLALGGAVDRTMQSLEPFILEMKLKARR